MQLHNRFWRSTWISKLPFYTTACVGVPLNARHAETSGNIALSLFALKSAHSHKSVALILKGSHSKCSTTSLPLADISEQWSGCTTLLGFTVCKLQLTSCPNYNTELRLLLGFALWRPWRADSALGHAPILCCPRNNQTWYSIS